MKRNLRWLISAALLVAVLMGVVVPASATSGTKSGSCGLNATWNFDETTGTLTISGTGAMKDYDSSYRIWAPWAFEDVKAVEIKDGITHIANDAFVAFESGEQLTSIIIPDSVTSIGSGAFSGCGFSAFQVPKNITTMCADAFDRCPNLTEFSVEAGNTAFCAIDGILYDITGTTLIRFPRGEASTFTIPPTVKRIGEYAFSSIWGLTSVTIPEGVTVIGDYAFAGCRALPSVVIPEGVTVIGDHAFWNCRALSEISLPTTLKEIKEDAFLYCRELSSITLPEGLTTIGGGAFHGSGLTALNIPSGVSNFSVGVFEFGETEIANIQVSEENQFYCSVDGVLYDKAKTTLLSCLPLKAGKLTVPLGVTKINAGACASCNKLSEVSLPEGLVSIGDQAFLNCWSFDDGLRKVNIPSSVTEIGDHAFASCTGLTEITLPEGLTRIGAYAFHGCGAKSISVPDAVVSIGEDAFWNPWDTVILKGRRGGYVETYAQQNGLKFSPLDLPPIVATPNRSTVLVNSEKVAFDAYTINQNNYFKLRDLAKVLSGTGKQFEVTWDGSNKAINMLSGKPYTAVGGELAQGDGANKTATINTATIYLDGQPVSLLAYTINQNNYFKLRDVGQAFDFDVTWDGVNNTIVIDTTQSYTAD